MLGGLAMDDFSALNARRSLSALSRTVVASKDAPGLSLMREGTGRLLRGLFLYGPNGSHFHKLASIRPPDLAFPLVSIGRFRRIKANRRVHGLV
jgi:hypothetical protein